GLETSGNSEGPRAIEQRVLGSIPVAPGAKPVRFKNLRSALWRCVEGKDRTVGSGDAGRRKTSQGRRLPYVHDSVCTHLRLVSASVGYADPRAAHPQRSTDRRGSPGDRAESV